MSDERALPPVPPPAPPRASGVPAAFVPVYVPIGAHPRVAVLDAWRRAPLVAGAYPEGTRFLFEMHLDAP